VTIDKRSHSVAQRGTAARNSADAEIISRTDAVTAETTEVVVVAASNEAVRGVSSEGAERATELVSEFPLSLNVAKAVSPAGVLEPNILIRQLVVRNPNSC